jgi:IS30 family transposase
MIAFASPQRIVMEAIRVVSIRADGSKIPLFQYSAVNDATRMQALKIYPRHTQENAIRFIDYVVSKFPFRIHTIRTDNGHEFQDQVSLACRGFGNPPYL